MEINRNLQSSSIDYFEQSLELAHLADEYGTHRYEKSNLKNKLKWKLAIICITQAIEILCKYVLEGINPKLVFKNIDCDEKTFNETISIGVAYLRIKNFTDFLSTDIEDNLIRKTSQLRNKFIHYDVTIQTEYIKDVFCRLTKLYVRLYSELIAPFPFEYEKDSRYMNFIHFADNLVIFRGEEVNRDFLEEFKSEIVESSKHEYYTNNDNKYKRIRFGEEIELLGLSKNDSIYGWEYCDDCSAKQGEFHLPHCDLEVCPKCKGQRLSCGCFDKYY